MAMTGNSAALAGSDGVFKTSLKSIQLTTARLDRDLTRKLAEQRNQLMILAHSDAFKGKAASALSQHITQCIIPIINNEIEVCRRLHREANRILAAYDQVDGASDAVIKYDGVNAAVSRVDNLTDQLHVSHKRLKSINARAAALGCDVSPANDGALENARNHYEHTCRKLVDRCKRLDSMLTASIKALSRQITLINNIAKSSRRKVHGKVHMQTSGNAVDLTSLAWRAIRGEFGNGQARKDALGGLYDEVQALVNEIWDVNGGLKPGVTQPAKIDMTPIAEIQAQRAKSDPILSAQWDTPARVLPFGKGETGHVFDLRNGARVITGELRFRMAPRIAPITPRDFLHFDNTFRGGRFAAPIPAASEFRPAFSFNAVRDMQFRSLGDAMDKAVFGIRLRNSDLSKFKFFA